MARRDAVLLTGPIGLGNRLRKVLAVNLGARTSLANKPLKLLTAWQTPVATKLFIGLFYRLNHLLLAESDDFTLTSLAIPSLANAATEPFNTKAEIDDKMIACNVICSICPACHRHHDHTNSKVADDKTQSVLN
jgi:hypothetical protein